VNLFENNKEIKMGIEMCLDADERVKIAALYFVVYIIITNRKYSNQRFYLIAVCMRIRLINIKMA
jgi:hypothetical protein